MKTHRQRWRIANKVSGRVHGAVAGICSDVLSVVACTPSGGGCLGVRRTRQERDSVAVRSLAASLKAAIDTLAVGGSRIEVGDAVLLVAIHAPQASVRILVSTAVGTCRGWHPVRLCCRWKDLVRE